MKVGKVGAVVSVVSVFVAMIVPRCRGQESFDAVVLGQMEKQRIPGIAIIVVRDGTVVKKVAYGRARRRTRRATQGVYGFSNRINHQDLHRSSARETRTREEVVSRRCGWPLPSRSSH